MTAARALHQPVCSLTPTPTARWWRYVHEKRVHCPCGHHIPRKAVIPEWGFLRCDAREPAVNGARGPECGRWLFLFAIAGGGCIVAEVSLDEIEPMRELRTPSAVLQYLGIFPA